MHSYEKKSSYSSLYVVVVTLIAIFCIGFACYENHGKNVLQKSYERDLKVADNSYLELQEEYSKVKNQLEIVTDEYNDLYQSGQ